jgi:preprotein translocase subunit SecG
MFLYGFLISLYVFISLLLIVIIMIQKGKSSMGLGGLGGGSQMLFGGSGGQDLFQKMTWAFIGIFIGLSILLFFMRSNSRESFRFLSQQAQAPLSMPTDASELPKDSEIPAE